ncbi:MAG: cysteine desulfurase family protein [Acidimicrobiia bacterium]
MIYESPRAIDVGSFISFDQAASTPLRPAVLDAMMPWLLDGANPSGAHRAAQAARTVVEEARERVAELMCAGPREVVFTSGGTESDNLAVLGGAVPAARALQQSSDHDPDVPPNVIVSAIEHKAVLEPCAELARIGVAVRTLGITSDGHVEPMALASLIDERTVFVSVMTVNNELGSIQPIDELARTVRRARQGTLFHTDAVQAPLWIDVGEATKLAHLVSLSGHKFGGPKGAGVLVVRETALEPQVRGGGQEFGLRGGTLNTAAIVGFAEALSIAHTEREEVVIRVARLRERLEQALIAGVPGLRVNAPGGSVGHLHVTLPDINAEVALIALDREGIGVSAGASCASGATDASHVLTAIGMPDAEARCSLRISLSFATTEAMIDRATVVVPRTLAALIPART